jgi:hypothetical protein
MSDKKKQEQKSQKVISSERAAQMAATGREQRRVKALAKINKKTMC